MRRWTCFSFKIESSSCSHLETKTERARMGLESDFRGNSWVWKPLNDCAAAHWMWFRMTASSFFNDECPSHRPPYGSRVTFEINPAIGSLVCENATPVHLNGHFMTRYCDHYTFITHASILRIFSARISHCFQTRRP